MVTESWNILRLGCHGFPFVETEFYYSGFLRAQKTQQQKQQGEIMFKIFKRKQQDVYSMSYEEMVNSLWNDKAIIIATQERMSHTLSAMDQIQFNIKFETESVNKEFGVKPALLNW